MIVVGTVSSYSCCCHLIFISCFAVTWFSLAVWLQSASHLTGILMMWTRPWMRSMSRQKTWSRFRKHCQLQLVQQPILMRLLICWCFCKFVLGLVPAKKESTFCSLFGTISWALLFYAGDTRPFCHCRMNWKQNSKSWKVLSWKNSFFSQQQLLLQLPCRPLSANNEIVLRQSVQLRKMNWLHFRLRWHSEQVPFCFSCMVYPFTTPSLEFSCIAICPFYYAYFILSLDKKKFKTSLFWNEWKFYAGLILIHLDWHGIVSLLVRVLQVMLGCNDGWLCKESADWLMEICAPSPLPFMYGCRQCIYGGFKYNEVDHSNSKNLLFGASEQFFYFIASLKFSIFLITKKGLVIAVWQLWWFSYVLYPAELSSWSHIPCNEESTALLNVAILNRHGI